MDNPESVDFGKEPRPMIPAEVAERVDIGRQPPRYPRFWRYATYGAFVTGVAVAGLVCVEHSGTNQPDSQPADKTREYSTPTIRIGQDGQRLNFTPMGAYLVSANTVFASATEPVHIEFSNLSCKDGEVHGDLQLDTPPPLKPITERGETLPFSSLTIDCLLSPYDRGLNTGWITVGQDSPYRYQVADATLGPELRP